MPSQLPAIVAGIAGTLRSIGVFKNVITYKPDQPGPLPMVYLASVHLDYPGIDDDLDSHHRTYGEMALGHTLDWFVVLAPIPAKAEEVELRLFALVPQVIEALGHDLDCGGALIGQDAGGSDGQVMLTDADEGQTVIGKVPWYAYRLRMRVIERFTFQYSP